MKSVSLEEMAVLLKKMDNYRIIYHIRPDGDCIGSAYALALSLQSIGKKCKVTGEYPVPDAHISMTSKILSDDIDGPVNIAIDSGSPDRLGIFQNEHYTFCIDHHLDNSVIADYKYIEGDAGACSEIILKLIKLMGVTVTKDIADLLYMALVTDTMCFRTYDTTQQSFLTAAEWAGYGADIAGIGRKNMFIKSKQRIALEELLKNSFHFSCDDQILTGIITLNDLKTADIKDSELEGINSFVDQVEGVKIGVTIRELPDGNTRCSMRTSGSISANEICQFFGGGGHYHAAACILEMSVYEARIIIEQVCESFLRKYESGCVIIEDVDYDEEANKDIKEFMFEMRRILVTKNRGIEVTLTRLRRICRNFDEVNTYGTDEELLQSAVEFRNTLLS